MVDNFELIKDILGHWMSEKEAIISAFLFCEIAGNIGTLKIPIKSHKRKLAIFMLQEGHNDKEILVITKISPRMLKIYKKKYV